MIKSMTGYGIAENTELGKKISVEIKSVNHRYCDMNIRAPRAYGYIEDVIRRTLSEYISRGKVDVYVNIEDISEDDTQILINKPLAKGYYDVLTQIKNEFGIEDRITLTNMACFSGIFNVEKKEEDSDGILAAVGNVAKMAAESFSKMRETEGERLYDDLTSGASNIENMVCEIEKFAPVIVEKYSQRLRTRMTEILGEIPIDENKLMNEVAVFSDRVDVNEEIIRLKSHIAQLQNMLQKNEPIGRKLDFIIQEMNREINTIGSKSNDLDVAKIVIDVKAEIEKLREQIQNVE